MNNLFSKIFSITNIISFSLGLIFYPILHFIFRLDSTITVVSTFGYTIITFFILITAISAKSSWEKEQKLKTYQKVFESLVNIINWLNDFYDFTIDEKLYSGQKAYELPFTGENYNDKKKFIIHGCKGAFSHFEKVGMAMNKLLISETTEEEIKTYCENLKKIFEDLQKSNGGNQDEKRPIELKITTDNLELQKIINSIRHDSGIKEETKCQI